MYNVNHEGLHKGCNGARAKDEKWKNLERVEVLVKRLRITNTTTKTKTTSHHTDKSISKPLENLKEGIKLAYRDSLMPTNHFINNFLISFLVFFIVTFALSFFSPYGRKNRMHVNGMQNTKSVH